MQLARSSPLREQVIQCTIAAARLLLPTNVYGDKKSYTEKSKVEQTVTAASNAAADDRNAFHVLPGYNVEHPFSVPKSELGSWVAMTTDNKERLIVSDQEGKGLCRVTTPALHPHLATASPTGPGPLPKARERVGPLPQRQWVDATSLSCPF